MTTRARVSKLLTSLMLVAAAVILTRVEVGAVDCSNTCAHIGSILQGCSNVQYSWCGNGAPPNQGYCGWAAWNDNSAGIVCNNKTFYSGSGSDGISGYQTYFAYNNSADCCVSNVCENEWNSCCYGNNGGSCGDDGDCFPYIGN